MLSGALRQGGKLLGGMRNPFRNLLWDGDSYLAGVIKGDRISVNDLERSDRSIAFHATNRLLANPLDIGVRIECFAIWTTGCGIRISQIVAFHPSIVTRGCRHRGDIDVADPKDDCVSGRSSIHIYGSCHLVTAPNSWRDHRSPASGRRVSHHCPPTS